MLGYVAGAAPANKAVAVGKKTEGAEHCGCAAAWVWDVFDDLGSTGGEVEKEDDGGGGGSGWGKLEGIVGVVEDGNGTVGGG